jgi:hypothetical protein
MRRVRRRQAKTLGRDKHTNRPMSLAGQYELILVSIYDSLYVLALHERGVLRCESNQGNFLDQWYHWSHGSVARPM